MNNLMKSKFIKVLTLLVVFTMLFSDIVVLADAVITEETIEENKIKENVNSDKKENEKKNREPIIKEEVVNEKEDKNIVEENKEDKKEERTEPADGEYTIRHEVIGTEEILMEESYPMEIGKEVKGEERKNHILIGTTSQIVTEENRDITFYYANKIKKNPNIKQISIKYVSKDNKTGKEKEILPRVLMPIFRGKDFKISGPKIDGFKLMSDIKTFNIDNVDDQITIEYKPMRAGLFSAMPVSSPSPAPETLMNVNYTVLRKFVDESLEKSDEDYNVLNRISRINEIKFNELVSTGIFIEIKEGTDNIEEGYYALGLGLSTGSEDLSNEVVDKLKEYNFFIQDSLNFVDSYLDEKQIDLLKKYVFYDDELSIGEFSDEAWEMVKGTVGDGDTGEFKSQVAETKLYDSEQLKKDNETIYVVRHIRNHKLKESKNQGDRLRIVKDMYFREQIGAKVSAPSLSISQLDEYFPDEPDVQIREIWKTMDKELQLKLDKKYESPIEDNDGVVYAELEELYEVKPREQEVNTEANNEGLELNESLNVIEFVYTDTENNFKPEENNKLKSEYTIDLWEHLNPDISLNKKVDEGYVFKGEAIIGSNVTRNAAEIKDYTVVGQNPQTLNIEKEKNNNKMNFYYMKDEDLKEKDKNGNAFFRIEHYKIDKTKNDDIKVEDVNNAKHIETTIGKDRVGNYIFAKDKSIDYRGYEFQESLTRNWKNQPKTPNENGAKGFIIIDPSGDGYKENTIKLYYLTREEENTDGKDEGETSDPEKIVKYEVFYRNINKLNEEIGTKFNDSDLVKDATDEELERFESFYNYVAEGVDNEKVRIYGQTSGKVGEVDLKDFVLLTKSPIRKTLVYGEGDKQPYMNINILYASNRDDEIDEDLEKENLSRVSERHILKRTVQIINNNGESEDKVIYEDIINPIVNNYPTGVKIQGTHSKQLINLGYKKLTDDYELLETKLEEAGRTYELRMIYEADENTTPPEENELEKVKVKINHYDGDVKDSSGDDYKILESSEIEVLVGRNVKLSHKKINNYDPWYAHKDEVNEVNIPEEGYQNEYTLKFFYKEEDDSRVEVTIKYISKTTDGEEEIELGKYVESVRVPTYLRHEPYKNMFDNGEIINAKDVSKFEFKSANPETLLVNGSNQEMILEYTHTKGDKPTEPKPKPVYKTVTIDYILRDGEKNEVVTTDISTGLKGSKAIVESMYSEEEFGKLVIEKDLGSKEDKFQLISANPMEVTHKLNGKYEFVYVKKTKGEIEGLDKRYFIRNIEELKVGDSTIGQGKPEHYFEVLDPITDVVEMNTMIDFKMTNEEEEKGILSGDTKLYDFERYYPENGVIMVEKNSDSEGFRIYIKSDDFDEDKEVEEPEVNKSNYTIKYKDKKTNNDIKDKKEYVGTVGLTYKVLAKQRITKDENNYILLAETKNPFTFELKEVGEEVIFNYNKDTDLPVDTEEKTYIVRHVRMLDNSEKYLDIINPTENKGLVDSVVELTSFTDEELETIFGPNNPYEYSGKYLVNQELKTDNNNRVEIVLDKDIIQEVLFIYDFKDGKDQDIDPEIDEEGNSEEDKFDKVKYTVKDVDNFNKIIKKFINLDTPTKSKITILRENNYKRTGGKINREDGVGEGYTLHSNSRIINDFTDRKSETFEFIYQKNVLAPMFDRFSVRYVEYDEDKVSQLESNISNDDKYHEIYKSLEDLKSRTVGQGTKSSLEVNLYNVKADFLGKEYEYKGYLNAEDGKFVENINGNRVDIHGDANNGRRDFIVFFQLKDEDTDMIRKNKENSMKPYSAIVEYEGNGMSMTRVIGSDTPEVKIEPLSIDGYTSRSGKPVTFKLDENTKSTMPITVFKYDHTGETEEPKEELEEEKPETEEPKEELEEEKPEIEEPKEELEEEKPEIEEPKEELKEEKPSTNGGGGGGILETPKQSLVDKKVKDGIEKIDEQIEQIEKENKKVENNKFNSRINTDPEVTYITGYSDNTIRPNENITRQEVAAIIFRVMDEDFRNDVKTNKHEFTDIEEKTWSREFIATLSNADLIKGFKDGSFKPHESMTRAELATIIARLNGLEETNKYEFNDISNHWAAGSINAVAKKGWINGYKDGSFRPTEEVTRAELITMINNMLGRDTENKVKDKKQFDDLEKDRWYYKEIQVAVSR